MFSAYSPFFTSGLLSEGSSAHPSRSPSPPPRRGSLPNDTLPSALLSSTYHSSPSAESAAYYCKLQSSRDQTALRSFLSLDLAESQTLRSASLKRKPTKSKWTSWSSKPATWYSSSAPSSSPPPPMPRFRRTPSPTSASQLVRSSSREGRTIPSPKPVPNATLPALPPSALPPRLPSIPPTPPIRLSSESPRSFPIGRRPSTSPSTVSTRCRKNNRSDALAALEGRDRALAASRTVRKRVQQSNFMSMSDDDDTDDEESRAVSEEWLAKARAILLLAAQEGASVPSSPAPAQKVQARAQRVSAGRSPRSRRRRSNAESWMPLVSFMDLKDDDWNWRSFVEVAGV